MRTTPFLIGRPSGSAQTGFTLIELVIVVAIVAILASVAIPSYRSYVLRAHRAEAKTALLGVASAQERFFLARNRYATNAELTEAPPAGLGLPATTEHGRYTITIADGADATGFSVTATAVSAQVADETCATLSLDSAGTRLAAKRGGGDSPTCWD